MSVVETAAGRVGGTREGSILVFRGVPYARSPTGTDRWRAPSPPTPWAGIRDARQFGAMPPQAASVFEHLWGRPLERPDEDCLTLNIWTPACDAAKRPIMVEIHGGAFVSGAGSLEVLSGRHLSENGDVVVVTINYRLGCLGFLNLVDTLRAEEAGSGVEGLLDQIAALQWVRAHAPAFGGDPDNITLFGESAGALSACALVASPLAKGLFHKVIAQSGAAHSGQSREQSAAVTRKLLAECGQREPHLSDLQMLKVEDLIAAQQRAGAVPAKALPFSPTFGGALLPARPIEAIRNGAGKGIPLLIGYTRDEWKLFTAERPALSSSAFRRLIDETCSAGSDELARYYDEIPAADRYTAFLSDQKFVVPASRLVDAHSTQAPVFAYRFDWVSPLRDGQYGSCHALDLGFVHGTFDEPPRRAFYGSGPQANLLSKAMIKSWTNFARASDPSCAEVGSWPARHPGAPWSMVFGGRSPYLALEPVLEKLECWRDVADADVGI